jgi:hypothetical protein
MPTISSEKRCAKHRPDWVEEVRRPARWNPLPQDRRCCFSPWCGRSTSPPSSCTHRWRW